MLEELKFKKLNVGNNWLHIDLEYNGRSIEFDYLEDSTRPSNSLEWLDLILFRWFIYNDNLGYDTLESYFNLVDYCHIKWWQRSYFRELEETWKKVNYIFWEDEDVINELRQEVSLMIGKDQELKCLVQEYRELNIPLEDFEKYAEKEEK